MLQLRFISSDQRPRTSVPAREPRNMTRLVTIVLLFVLHTTTATIDLAHLPEQIQKLKEMKTAAFHSAAAKLHDLKETAAYNIQHLADDIDLNNLHKLDVLQIGPTLKKKYNLLKKLYNKPATKVNVVHIYGDELSSHFDHVDHANLIHGHHGHHHSHHGHHGHHHDHYHELPEWVLVGAHA